MSPSDAPSAELPGQLPRLHPTAAAFRSAVERGAHEDAVGLLAPGVSFHSPIVFRTYRGREAVAPVLAAVVQVFEGFRYTAAYAAADGSAGAVLAFSCQVSGRDLDGVDILHFAADGSIDDFTVMVRPYSAATLLRERMAALLAEGTGG